MSSQRIEGIAVVTGGASGIGAACCHALAAAGATVAVLDRDEARANALAAEIKGEAWVADVGDEQAIEACAGAIEAAVGLVNILVNSAGVIQVPVAPEQLAMSAWDDVVRIDQRGTYVAWRADAAASSTSLRLPGCARRRFMLMRRQRPRSSP
jgi:NAD(P)-dependent dehydrogenase (short-subunit alcohol dehydrogenase family)